MMFNTGIDKVCKVSWTGVKALIYYRGVDYLNWGSLYLKLKCFKVSLDRAMSSVRNSGCSFNILLSIEMFSKISLSTSNKACLASNFDLSKLKFMRIFLRFMHDYNTKFRTKGANFSES